MSGAGSAEPALMLLYDGDCGYCNGWVWWLLRHDAGGSLCFAMLQGAHGAAFLERVPALARLDSIILVSECSSHCSNCGRSGSDGPAMPCRISGSSTAVGVNDDSEAKTRLQCC